MKKLSLFSLFAIAIMTWGLSSCELVGGVFKAGAWFGVVGVILVVVLIFWIFSRFFRR